LTVGFLEILVLFSNSLQPGIEKSIVKNEFNKYRQRKFVMGETG